MNVLLIQKAKRHDREAFTELMRSNGESMYKVAKAILKNDKDIQGFHRQHAQTQG